AWILALHPDAGLTATPGAASADAQRSAARAAEALQLIDRAIATIGPLPDLLDTRAVVNVMLGRSGPAVEDLRLALAEAPTAAKYFHLARAQQCARNPRAADDALRRANALGLKSADLHPLERRSYDQLMSDLARR